MINRRHNNIFYTCGLIFSLVIYPGLVNAAGEDNKAGDINRGAQKMVQNCTRCHNLRDLKEFRDDEWWTIVQHMRVVGGLTGQQTRDIHAYLQSGNYTAVVVSPSGTLSTRLLSGQEIYSSTCIACHGANGKGVISGVPDFKDRLSKSDEILLQHIINGFQTPGSPMAMPPRGGNITYTDEELQGTLSYIKSKFGK